MPKSRIIKFISILTLLAQAVPSWWGMFHFMGAWLMVMNTKIFILVFLPIIFLLLGIPVLSIKYSKGIDSEIVRDRAVSILFFVLNLIILAFEVLVLAEGGVDYPVFG